MVVSSLKREVASLKTQAGGGGGGGCGYCSGGDDGSGGGGGPYTIYFDDEVPDDFEDVCPECGEEHVIYFDDDSRAPWNLQ